MPTLRDKFRGCIAATWIGSAMGAIVEGGDPEKIERGQRMHSTEEGEGQLDELMDYEHYGNDWVREAGTTEDGIERQKMMATAIIENEGRIIADDLVDVWIRDADPDKMVMKQEAFDKALRELAEIGVPTADLGRMWIFPNINSVARASHPLGLINAGKPKDAADDTHEVGKVYAREGTPALRWAALYNAAIAEACKPNTTVNSVLDTALEFASYRKQDGLHGHDSYDRIEEEVERAIELGKESEDATELRDAFSEYYYGGDYIVYHMSRANEVVSKGLGIFALHQDNTKESIVTAVNFGRDTDCTAAVASGLSGTFGGPETIPQQWINQVDEATKNDPYTNNQRTIEETADGLFEAYRSRIDRMKEHAEIMESDEYLA